MVTVDILAWLMYAQLILSVVLFFAPQIVVLIAHFSSDGILEQVGEWMVCRGTWIGMFVQVVSLAILAFLVFSTQTDHTRVTYTGVLIVLNTTWFAALKLVFLVADYVHNRQMRMRRKEQ
jgi:hypothetical protein